jgi:transposase
MRIQFFGATVKSLQAKLALAVKHNNGRLIRRLSVLLALGQHGLKIAEVAKEWGLCQATVYNWLSQLALEGLNSLHYQHGGGAKSRLSLLQKRELCQLLDAGPVAAGFESHCWSSVLIAELIEVRFKVKYNRHYVVALLKGLGYSYQKGEFENSHLDQARRAEWREVVWPKLLAQAQAEGGLILFGDEVSFAQWGSLSYTWARQGQTPKIKTSGKRKGYKVFGAIDYFSGRLFYQGSEGKFNGESYKLFITKILQATTQPIFMVQDGARYHTSKALKEFFGEQPARLRVYQLPAYSPDYNPIEYLWRRTKRQATHNTYFEQFGELVKAVDRALDRFEKAPEAVLGLFGCYTNEAA